MDNVKSAAELFNIYANTYQDKFMDVGMYRGTFDLFCDNIQKPGANILDIACGPGNITKYLLGKHPDYNILGIDLAPNMLELAKANNPGAAFQLMDCRDISKLQAGYDGIMCGFCLPYLSGKEVQKLISDARDLLKPGGALYLSTMEGDEHMSGFKTSSSGAYQIYQHFYEADDLTAMLKQSAFTVINMQRINCPNADGTMTTDLIIVAKKQVITLSGTSTS